MGDSEEVGENPGAHRGKGASESIPAAHSPAKSGPGWTRGGKLLILLPQFLSVCCELGTEGPLGLGAGRPHSSLCEGEKPR